MKIETIRETGLITINPDGKILIGDRLMDSIDKGVIALFKNPLEAWRTSAEIHRMNRILNELNLKWREINWSEVNTISLLDILKASKNVDPKTQPELFKYWKNLLEKFFDAEHRYEEKCIEYSKILSNLTSVEAHYLLEIYSLKQNEQAEASLVLMFENDQSFSIIETLASKNFICIQYFGSKINNPMTGTSVSDIRTLGTQPLIAYRTFSIKTFSLVILLNFSTNEFVRFISKGI